MTIDSATIESLADAVAERLRPMMVPVGWPEGRTTLREPEAASLLGIGHEKMVELRRSGSISFRKVGATIMYASGDVADFLERCKRCENKNGDLATVAKSP